MTEFVCGSCDNEFLAPDSAESCSFCGSNDILAVVEDYDSWDDSAYDGDALASIGWGTDEDYGWFGEQGLWD